MPQYAEGATTVGAARITEIKPCDMGDGKPHKTLVFGELDRHANVKSDWLDRNTVEVGGWFVAFDTGGAGFMTDQNFSARFVLVPEGE